MTERDEGATPPLPEFVAVTPRGAIPDEPVAPQEPSAVEPESEPEPERPAVEPEPPAVEPEPPVIEPEPPAVAPEPPAVEPEPPAPTSMAVGDPDPDLPEPPPARDGDVEVSVRVAAEGMANALAGLPLDAETEDASSRARSVGRMTVVTAVLVVLAIAAGVVLVITARSNSHRHAADAARKAALAAALHETPLALTYSYKTLDADFARAEAGMSHKFRANYAQTVADSVAPLATKNHAVTTGSVAAGGVVSATPSTVRILVFANQVVENKLLSATSRLDRSVIEVTMVKESGRWVIDGLQPY